MFMEPITFRCAVAKVQTLADGGLRVWLDLPEDATLAAAHLMTCQQYGQYLSAELVEAEESPNGGTGTVNRRAAKRRK